MKIIVNVTKDSDKHLRICGWLAINGYDFFQEETKSTEKTMFDEEYIKQKQALCTHPDTGTDGGGDYCKKCGKRWDR